MTDATSAGVLLQDFPMDDTNLFGLVQTLGEIEKENHSRGWDMPAMLYRVTETTQDLSHMDIPVSATDFVKAYLVHPFPLGGLAHPREELGAMAWSFKMILEVELDGADESGWREKIAEALTDPVLAHVVIIEAWARTAEGVTQEEALEQFEGKSFADMVGSVEVRFATLVTDDHVLLLTRVRGEEPRVDAMTRDASLEPLRIGGQLTDHLIMLHDVTQALSRKVKEEAA